MAHYETDDQQIEALKEWWSENGTSLIAGLLIGVLALGGWQYFIKYRIEHSEQASDIYIALIKQVDAGGINEDDPLNLKLLRTDYSDTPYASLSSLMLAKYSFDSGNINDARDHLKWAVDNSNDVEFENIARTRLVRILLSEEKYDDAEKLLMNEHPESFNALYEELKGDLYVSIGEISQARVAYDKALTSLGNINANRWLKLKRNNLGSADLKKIVDDS